jgi:putative endonuclease
MASKSQIDGYSAEHTAEQYLRRQGLRSITRNYACRYGEIDLIMQENDCMIFIEVRMRNNPDFGLGIETVNLAKQQRIRKTAQHFLQFKQQYDKIPCRFDLVGILKNKNLTWVKNAF